jgi:hypothetical protein
MEAGAYSSRDCGEPMCEMLRMLGVAAQRRRGSRQRPRPGSDQIPLADNLVNGADLHVGVSVVQRIKAKWVTTLSTAQAVAA